MKSVRLPFCLIICLLLACNSPQHVRKKHNLSGVFPSKNWISVSKNLYAYRFEMDNIGFREFLNAQQSDCRPDSTAWYDLRGSYDPYVKNYFSHPAFYTYPVINLSHECAQAYCAWLTERYHEMEKRPFAKVIIRLPTEAEWEMAAKGGDGEAIFPWTTESPSWLSSPLQDKKGRYRANFLSINQLAIMSVEGDSALRLSPEVKELRKAGLDLYTFMAPVESFEANPMGIYNMGGNVAEMIQTPGICKGGSWYQTAFHLQINKTAPYNGPSPFLGFRPFMEVLAE